MNPEWAGLVVFGIAFLESLAIVGLAVPGWLLLVGVGTFIGSGALNFYEMAAFSFSGAVLGQGLSFLVGYKFQRRIHHWPFVERHQKLMDNSEKFFVRHGVASIIVGQFIGPIRAVIALMAGILDMPVKMFAAAMLLAAFIWAPLYFLPGIAVGAALTFEREHIGVLLALLLGICICVWLLSRYLFVWFRSQRKPDSKFTPIPRFRLKLGLVSLVALVIIGILVKSQYGPMMADLTWRMWEVIS